MKARLLAVTLAVVLAAFATSGCSAQPEPAKPTPAFTNEEEAFAAAEETYRAYVDALNQVDLSDPETFEDVFAWTTGDANSEARRTFARMHADGWTVGGSSVATVIESRSQQQDSSDVQVAICLNVSMVDLVDADGRSVVDSSRPDVQSMLITLRPSTATATGLAISAFEGRQGTPACE